MRIRYPAVKAVVAGVFRGLFRPGRRVVRDLSGLCAGQHAFLAAFRKYIDDDPSGRYEDICRTGRRCGGFSLHAKHDQPLHGPLAVFRRGVIRDHRDDIPRGNHGDAAEEIFIRQGGVVVRPEIGRLVVFGWVRVIAKRGFSCFWKPQTYASTSMESRRSTGWIL